MASNRHLGRIIVLQSLYEIAFRRSVEDETLRPSEVVERNISRYQAAAKDSNFIISFANGILEHEAELNVQIQPLAPDWPLDHIARIDHMILLMGAYELQYHQDVPPKVVINEAVELAKSFGGENSSRFVNGVLGSLLKQLQPDYAENPSTTDEKENDSEET